LGAGRRSGETGFRGSYRLPSPSTWLTARAATRGRRHRAAGWQLTALVALHLALFTTVAYVAHRRLAADRPTPVRLTRFYLAVALGGALGGVFNALLAPSIFNRVIEYPLVMAAAVGVLVWSPIAPGLLTRRYGQAGRLLTPVAALPVVLVLLVAPVDASERLAVVYLLGLVVLGVLGARRWRGIVAISVALALIVIAVRPTPYLLASRTFFGVYRVYEQGGQMLMEHGKTVHGREWTDPAKRDQPIGYYSPASPIGQVFNVDGDHLHQVTVVGLGVGTLGAYGRPDLHMTFIDIDPEVVRIARDTGYFHYLADTTSPTDIVVGDGRLEVATLAPASQDLVVLDAFSSDAIPVHLMTKEAVALYLDRLASGGMLAFHISNNHLDLAPVLAGIAHDLGVQARMRIDRRDLPRDGVSPSQWVVIAAPTTSLAAFTSDAGWQDLAGFPRDTWTDDYSNPLAVLK